MTVSRWKARGVIVCMERDLELVLVARLRLGEDAAFDAIYDAWNTRIYRFLVRMEKIAPSPRT